MAIKQDQYGLINVRVQMNNIDAATKELLGKATGRAKRKAMKRSLKPVVKEMKNRIPKLHPDSAEEKQDPFDPSGKKRIRELKRARRARTARRQSGKKLTTTGTKGKTKVKATKQSGGTMNLIKKSIGSVVRVYKSGTVVGVVGPRKGYFAHDRERIDKIAISIEKGWKNRTPVPFMEETMQNTRANFKTTFKKELEKAYDAEQAAIKKKLNSKGAR